MAEKFSKFMIKREAAARAFVNGDAEPVAALSTNVGQACHGHRILAITASLNPTAALFAAAVAISPQPRSRYAPATPPGRRSGWRDQAAR
jgi:hypothetical protein